ncbi:MAG TPA: TrbC/VirB2 family protein [Methylobacter sp.]|jgi:hypothetical protein
MKLFKNCRSLAKKVGQFAIVAVASLAASGAAFAQQALNLSQQNDAVSTQSVSLMSTIGSWLLYSGLGVVTICIMLQGYKMMFKKHEWSDVGHVFMGAVFIGGAATLAGIFFKVL